MSIPDVPPKVRGWLYRVTCAALPALAAAGVITGGQAGLWLTLAGAVLGTGTAGVAAAHRPTTPPAAPSPAGTTPTP